LDFIRNTTSELVKMLRIQNTGILEGARSGRAEEILGNHHLRGQWEINPYITY
jgi:hypothetical protein